MRYTGHRDRRLRNQLHDLVADATAHRESRQRRRGIGGWGWRGILWRSRGAWSGPHSARDYDSSLCHSHDVRYSIMQPKYLLSKHLCFPIGCRNSHDVRASTKGRIRRYYHYTECKHANYRVMKNHARRWLRSTSERPSRVLQGMLSRDRSTTGCWHSGTSIYSEKLCSMCVEVRGNLVKFCKMVQFPEMLSKVRIQYGLLHCCPIRKGLRIVIRM